MRCLVIDSSPESTHSLSTLLLAEADVQLLGCWRTLRDAAGAIDRDRPEVLFLDMDAVSDLTPPLVPAASVSLVALTGDADGAVAAFRFRIEGRARLELQRYPRWLLGMLAPRTAAVSGR